MFPELDEVVAFQTNEIERQRKIEFVLSITKENYMQKVAESDFLIPQNDREQNDLFYLFTAGMYDVRNRYYKAYVLNEILKKSTIGKLQVENAQRYIHHLAAYMTRLNYFTFSGTKKFLENEKSSIFAFLINSNNIGPAIEFLNTEYDKDTFNGYDEYHEYYYEFSFSLGLRTDSYYDRKHEIKPTIDFAIKNQKEIDQIIKCECETTDIITAVINDDIKYFKDHYDKERNFLRNNKTYSVLFDCREDLIEVAAMYRAHKIIEYILEKDPISTCTHSATVISAIIGDFDAIKLFGTKLKFFAATFIASLSQTNTDLIEYLYGKARIYLQQKMFILPPSSCIFLMKHSLISLFSFPPCNTKESYMLLSGKIYSGSAFILRSRGRSSVSQDVINYFCRYYIHDYETYRRLVSENDRFVEGVLNDADKFSTRMLENAFILSLTGNSSRPLPLLNRFIDVFGAKILNAKDEFYERIVFRVASSLSSQAVSVILNTEGFDINNSAHPEESAFIHYVIDNPDRSVLTVVLAAPGIDVNRLDKNKNSVLDLCTDPDVINTLIQAGCRSSKDKNTLDTNYPWAKINKKARLLLEPYQTINVSAQLINGSRSGKELGTYSKERTKGPFGFGCPFQKDIHDRFIPSLYYYRRFGRHGGRCYEIGGNGTIGQPKAKKE